MDETAAPRPAPVRISRTVHASRQRAFAAFSSAEAVKRWFAPAGFTIPEARVELVVGGPFEVLMRSPAGEEHWARGVVREASPFGRLAIDFTVEEPNGRALFRAFTEIDFSETPGGTRLDVTQSYTVLDPEAAWMAEGAPKGWAQTLDNLSDELLRLEARRSVAYGVFTVERTYAAPVARVWRALSDPDAKSRWFGGSASEWDALERSMDFRVGGSERASGRWKNGVVSAFDAVYHDIIPEARIVYSYVMWLNDAKISVSLATMELSAQGPGRATLKVTEQGAFLDGYDDDGSRERGTAFLLDRLGATLD
ncbi:uncharacterized protein YndB with AHSA1/START domain [Roseiarcus fermentans]|uniref:Uncharacterized protein YndB with AHSA1/START domain n=1 Tax=Roseiarcus fermentans TaxID=1473586 RepID=A0A366FNS1_9HYPH|nr:SRPBCC family protein [Roseiarcus fermentans]RBP16217.1 uncharacterized protein YndB with AHSA1/START domain [Roseiarcus fermentans]